MNFREVKAKQLDWIDTDHPFSNFLFIDQYYRSNPVLRRIFSLCRKLRYKSLLIEEISENDCALLVEENAALALREPGFKKSVVHRLSFFACPSKTEPKPDDFLGYAVFKSDVVGAETLDHVFESVQRPFRRARENNFLPGLRDYLIKSSLGDFSVNGIMYAQQNALTFVCAHVALRTALSIALPGADISYKDINDIAGIDHVSTKVGRGAGANGENGGLTLLQIEAVLRSFNLNVPQPLINEPSLGHSFPDEYQKHLYGYIESGYPALVCFELTAKQSGGPTERHLIPVIGHTFNEDAWAPDAQRIYFGANAGYFPSEHWLSSYVIHDDNVGPYFCIPRHYMKQENFRAICGIQRVLTSLLPIQAETVGLLYVDWIRKNLPKIGKDWYDRFVVFAENQSLVLRTLLLNKADYLGHLGALKSRQGTTFEPGLMAKIASKIPEDIWMIEVSAPELFSCSRRKFGEIILPATAPLPPQIDLSLLVAARLPGVLILADQGQFPVDFSVFEGHSELYSRCS